MAILDQFEVTVVVDGKPCEEVADEDTIDFRSVYIETLPGAHFEIQLAINPAFNLEEPTTFDGRSSSTAKAL
jgi:hypothetical protein